MKKSNHKIYYYISSALGFLLVFALYVLVSTNNSLYQTNVIGMPEHKAFDGTVYPVKVIPNYVKLASTRNKLPFESYDKSELVAIPRYDANDLKKSFSDLIWGNPEHDAIRNAKITYTVPYMGNYKLDGIEYAGSHLAVDIVIPVGTPIYSIANGVVVKVSQQDAGFGKHIVVQHKNVPSLNNPNEKVTLYSSYSHLSQTNVNVNDVVIKGQLIGKSGATGTVTTPHLHFQIDTSSAPWHPYWPFTWKEASDLGLDFFSAINAGLGKDKAMATTIHPMLYVQKYLDNNTVALEETKPSQPIQVDEKTYTVDEKPFDSYIIESNPLNSDNSNNVAQDTVESTLPVVEEIIVEQKIIVEDPKLSFTFDVSPVYYYENNELSFKLSLRDQFGNVYRNGFAGEVLISPVNDNIRVSRPLVNFMSFDSNFDLVKSFVVRNSGKTRLKIEYENESYFSDWFEVNKVELDSIFKDVSTSNKYYEGLVYLSNKGVINGYPDGTFKLNNPISRVEALKIILGSGNSRILTGSLSFKDTDNSSWYSSYLFTAVSRGIVSGYNDGSFRPSNNVTKAEYYKILLNTLEIEVPESVSYSPFVDVNMNEWFAPFIITAYENGLIDESVKYLSPNVAITRGEASNALYLALINANN